MSSTANETATVNGTSPAAKDPIVNGAHKTSPESASPAYKATEAWLCEFETAIAAKDVDAAAALFASTSFWRDFVAFTWNLVTVENPDGVRALLRAQLPHVDASSFQVTEEPTEDQGTRIAWFSFETNAGRGRGLLRLQEGKAWTFFTVLQELKGFEEPLGRLRPQGVVHGTAVGRKTWSEEREAEVDELGYLRQPYVLIIGGGQGGIVLAARLRQLGVSTIVIDSHPRPGDQWRRRYKSLCLHDPVYYDHLPYIPFPGNWPVFSPKDKIAGWLEMYVNVMELNYWGSTFAKDAEYNDIKGEWTVLVDRDGTEVTLRPKQLVLATGMSGKPSVPSFPGRERFQGEQHHSSAHPGPEPYRGQNVVVIGSNNSAHDICAALHENDATSVTMVQRSPTCIVSSAPLLKHGLGGLYSEEAVAKGITADKADLLDASVPYRLLTRFQRPLYDAIRAEEADFYAALERTGFRLDWSPDEAGLFAKYLRRGSGYYIDVGASQLLIDGKIKLASGPVAGLTERGVALADGTELPADLVVYATGYGSMNGWAADLISPTVADRVGKVWGYGSDTPKDPGPWEGELRNMWKPTRQPGLWFHGGNLAQTRHYSLYLALQLKARMEGLATPVFGIPEVHHLH